MSMEISNTTISSMAKKLFEKDEDKIITKEEIKLFVASNDAELTKAEISIDEAISELSKMFDSEKADEATKKEDGEDPLAEYNRLKAQIEQYNTMLAEFDLRIETLSKDAETLQKQMEEKIKAYNDLEAEVVKDNEHLERVINEINSTKENMEADVESRQKRAVWKAINDYNPEEDGDWESYLQKTCEGAAYSPLASKLNSLMSQSNITMNELKTFASKLSRAGSEIDNLSNKITDATSSIDEISSMKTSTTEALGKAQQDLNNSILNFVTEEEMKLVEDNGINLKEALPDGKPRYIFAKGKQDGKYHIYDMSNNASLARQFGCNGNGLRGSDIVPSGNGYITVSKMGEEASEGEDVFWLTDCGMQCDKACYCTCSPLGFDIQGDGYKLDTSKTVKFDIDGDGKLDNINDSLDAVLVFDKDGDGISGEDGSETFGDNTDLDNKGGKDGYANGFEALGALRDKAIKEGVLTDRGDGTLNADDLAALEKNYGLKIKTQGYNSEAKSLSDVGITEIKISDNKVSDKQKFDSFGNEIQTQQGATFKINGKENSYADIWHKKFSDSEAKELSGASSLTFDTNKIANFALSAKASVDSKTAQALSKVNATDSTLKSTNSKTRSDMFRMLNEDFWSGTKEPENFFIKSQKEKEEVEAKQEAKKQEIADKKQEIKEKQEAKKQEKLDKEEELKKQEEQEKLEEEEKLKEEELKEEN